MRKVYKKVFIFLLFNIIGLSTINVRVKGVEELVLANSAPSAILLEASTGTVIYEKDAKKARPPASMTKIMTMILVMEAIEKGIFSLNDKLTASNNAVGMGGTQAYLEAGEEMTVEDLLKAVAIASANDAAVVFAEAIGGSIENFVKMMNDKGTELGLVNTFFKNTNGLPEEGHYSCAYDMGIMGWHLIDKYGDTILKYTSIYEDYLRKGTDKEFWLVNTNKLIKLYPDVDGLKTGWTREAGYCLTATMKKNGIRFIAVVMGCDAIVDRNKDIMQMLNYGISTYELVTLIKEGDVVCTTENITFRPMIHNVIVSRDVTILVKKGAKIGTVTTKMKINNVLNKEEVGSLEIYIDNVLYETVELTTVENVQKAGFFSIFVEVMKNVFLNSK